MFGLLSFLAVIEEGNLEQVQVMRGVVNFIIQTRKLGCLDISKFVASLEAIFAVIDTWAKMTSKGAKAIFLGKGG